MKRDVKRGSCGARWCTKQHGFCEESDLLGVNRFGRLVVVTGSRPYLNVNTAEGKIAFHSGTKQLRRLRDAITKALRSAR